MSLTGKPFLTTNGTVSNDGFWPDLSLTKLMSQYRIPAEYADETIKWGLIKTAVEVNAILEPVKLAIITAGSVAFENYLDDNPAELGGLHPLAVHYYHAVYARTKAYLLQQFNSMNRRENAENAAKEAPETEQWWLDQSQAAIVALFDALVPDHTMISAEGVYVALI